MKKILAVEEAEYKVIYFEMFILLFDKFETNSKQNTPIVSALPNAIF